MTLTSRQAADPMVYACYRIPCTHHKIEIVEDPLLRDRINDDIGKFAAATRDLATIRERHKIEIDEAMIIVDDVLRSMTGTANGGTNRAASRVGLETRQLTNLLKDGITARARKALRDAGIGLERYQLRITDHGMRLSVLPIGVPEDDVRSAMERQGFSFESRYIADHSSMSETELSTLIKDVTLILDRYQIDGVTCRTSVRSGSVEIRWSDPGNDPNVANLIAEIIGDAGLTTISHEQYIEVHFPPFVDSPIWLMFSVRAPLVGSAADRRRRGGGGGMVPTHSQAIFLRNLSRGLGYTGTLLVCIEHCEGFGWIVVEDGETLRITEEGRSALHRYESRLKRKPGVEPIRATVDQLLVLSAIAECDRLNQVLERHEVINECVQGRMIRRTKDFQRMIIWELTSDGYHTLLRALHDDPTVVGIPTPRQAEILMAITVGDDLDRSMPGIQFVINRCASLGFLHVVGIGEDQRIEITDEGREIAEYLLRESGKTSTI